VSTDMRSILQSPGFRVPGCGTQDPISGVPERVSFAVATRFEADEAGRSYSAFSHQPTTAESGIVIMPLRPIARRCTGCVRGQSFGAGTCICALSEGCARRHHRDRYRRSCNKQKLSHQDSPFAVPCTACTTQEATRHAPRIARLAAVCRAPRKSRPFAPHLLLGLRGETTNEGSRLTIPGNLWSCRSVLFAVATRSENHAPGRSYLVFSDQPATAGIGRVIEPLATRPGIGRVWRQIFRARTCGCSLSEG
jgi:hypothetical protein